MRSDFMLASLKPLALFAWRLKYNRGARIQNYLFSFCMCFIQWRHTPDYPGDTFGLYAFLNQGGKASSELFHRWYYSLLGGLELPSNPAQSDLRCLLWAVYFLPDPTYLWQNLHKWSD